jgi:hypothetical protein
MMSKTKSGFAAIRAERLLVLSGATPFNSFLRLSLRKELLGSVIGKPEAYRTVLRQSS